MRRLSYWLLLVPLVIGYGCSDEVTSNDPKLDKDAAVDTGAASDAPSNADSNIVEDPDTGPKSCSLTEEIPKETSCNECLATNCCDTVKNCQGDTECLAFFTCMKTCDAGASCTGTCAAGKKQGSLQLFQAMALCAGNKCGDGGIKAGCPL